MRGQWYVDPVRNEKRSLYDVSEVDGGRACGCICSSCKQRLVVRKGDSLKRVHHFAYDAAATKNSNKKECEFSFFVAACLLIKQRLEESGGCEVNLPDGKITLSSKDVFGIERSVTYSYTTSSQVNLEDLRIEEKWGDLDVDVVGCLSGFVLV
ncbi:hypothetical protein CKJ79_15120 [Vibrio coralliilyticus]|nr:hypothetical protein CKJ79_15120 [Vibrio coralliilyticus]